MSRMQGPSLDPLCGDERGILCDWHGDYDEDRDSKVTCFDNSALDEPSSPGTSRRSSVLQPTGNKTFKPVHKDQIRMPKREGARSFIGNPIRGPQKNTLRTEGIQEH